MPDATRSQHPTASMQSERKAMSHLRDGFLALALYRKHHVALRTIARAPQTEYISLQALLAHPPHVILEEHGEERWLPRKNCPAIRNAPGKRPSAFRRHGVRGRC